MSRLTDYENCVSCGEQKPICEWCTCPDAIMAIKEQDNSVRESLSRISRLLCVWRPQ